MMRQPWLMVLLLIVWISSIRESAEQGTLPFLFENSSTPRLVELGPELSSTGQCQIVDVDALSTVIIVTGSENLVAEIGEKVGSGAIETGYHLDITKESSDRRRLSISYMAAPKRMALGIPLHPDRMLMTDWQSLPGIGEKLAQRIEKDRQENGDFGEIQALKRVKGISSKKIARWEEFF